ncbi:P-loop containing nucleoside triphosphate hydrolase protein [Pavlovales sp. CCMP2436]|nr:P-loop containing nucleoside triphosphate hydrolase protein [Pavlovales sp. CCMP2436]
MDFIMTLEDRAEAVAEAAASDDEDDDFGVAFAPNFGGVPRPEPLLHERFGVAKPGAKGVGKGGVKPAPAEAQVTFEGLKLARPLLKAVESEGFERPTRIQVLAIPLVLEGGDVCGTAETGSGKTAAFMLPVLQRLLYRNRRSASTAALVLLPTRELAMQCQAMTARLAKYMSVQISLVVGGLSLKAQEAEMRSRPDLVIGTPGRLIDLVRNSAAITLESVEVLVLDEADRLLELGFRSELDEILKMTPRSRQTLLFTATISSAVEQLIAASLNRPAIVKANEEMGVCANLVQEFVRVHAVLSAAATPDEQASGAMARIARESTLLSLCARSFTSGVLVFTRSRAQAHRLATLMRACELKVVELHGELTQLQRIEQLDRFRAGDASYLVATDLASRGLDIEGVQTVVNFEMPASLRAYVHRVGRTARAGRGGRAVSLVCGADKAVLEAIIKHAPHAVKTRLVPDASVEEWAAKVLGLQEQLRLTYKGEKEDKELRVAEMEVRPRRTRPRTSCSTRSRSTSGPSAPGS